MRPLRKATSFTLLLILLFHATACSVPLREIPPAPRPEPTEATVRGVVLYDSTRYEFDRRAEARWDDSTLVVAEPRGETTRFPMSEIYRLLIERAEDRRGVMIARGVGAAIAVGIVAAILIGMSNMQVAPGG